VFASGSLEEISKAARGADEDPRLVQARALAEGLGAGADEDAEGVIALADRADAEVEREAEVLRFEAVEVLVEDVAQRRLGCAVEEGGCPVSC
jgi:hypothetical protein